MSGRHCDVNDGRLDERRRFLRCNACLPSGDETSSLGWRLDTFCFCLYVKWFGSRD
jgi:hypothetical protein